MSAGLLNGTFRPSSPIDYCDTLNGSTTTTADVFHMQGYRDTLFNFNEGYDNALCFERAGNDMRLLQLVNGHPLPLLSEVNYTGRNTSMDIDEVVHCGTDAGGQPQRLIVKDMIFAWYEEKLRGQTGAADMIPDVCLVQQNTDPSDRLVDPNYSDGNDGGNPDSAFKYAKEGLVYDSVTEILVGASDLNGSLPQYACDSPVNPAAAHVCEIPTTTVNFGPDPVTGNTAAFVPVYTVPMGENRVMAGIPTAVLNVDTVHPDPLLFMGTAVLRAGSSEPELIHDQLTAIRNGDSDLISPGTVDFPWTDANGNLNKDGGPLHYACPPNEALICDRGRLTGISVRLLAGDQVGLIFYGHNLQYAENSSRTPGIAMVSGDVEMPILAPSPLPVSVNP